MSDVSQSTNEQAAQASAEAMAAAQAELEAQPGIMGRIFAAIANFFTAWIPNAAEAVAQVIPRAVESAGDALNAWAEEKILKRILEWVDKQIDSGMVSPELRQYLKDMVGKSTEAHLVLGVVMVAVLAMASVKSVVEVAMEDGSQRIRSLAHNTLPDPSAAIRAMFIDPSREGKVREVLDRYGISPERIEWTIDAAKAQLDPQTIQALL